MIPWGWLSSFASSMLIWVAGMALGSVVSFKLLKRMIANTITGVLGDFTQLTQKGGTPASDPLHLLVRGVAGQFGVSPDLVDGAFSIVGPILAQSRQPKREAGQVWA